MKVLKNHFDEDPKNYEITAVENEAATNPGDNYMALLIRSKITLRYNDDRVESQSYIVKASCSEYILSRFHTMAVECEVFEKEIEMYSEIIPAFEKLYAEVGVQASFGPKCCYSSSEPTPIIVMEDLSSQYKMTNKFIGLDRDHVELSLSWMAQFHAASMVYKDSKDISYDNKFNAGLYNMKLNKEFQAYFDGFIHHLTSALRKLPNGETTAQKVDEWRRFVYSDTCKALEYDENSFNVLNHGDPWINNLMFSYNNGHTLNEVKFIDYQFTFWGSAASDLYYFMMSSWQLDIKVKKFDDLIEFYFEKLVQNLTVLKYTKMMPVLKDLHRELFNRRFFGECQTLIRVMNLKYFFSCLDDTFNSSLSFE